MIKKLIAAILLSTLLCACSSDPPENGATYKLLYANSSNPTELTSVNATLTATNTEDAITELFSKLTFPESDSHISVIPKSVSLVESSLSDGICTLMLSPSYGNLAPYTRVTLNYVLVNTMSALPDVEQVTISSQNSTQTFTADEFITATPPAYYDTSTVNFKYITTDFTETATVERTFVLPSGTPLETYVVELLSQNPNSPELRSPFPDGTKINGVYLDSTTCVLDLSPEFITAAPHTPEAEKAILFSIVDTLTELPDVNRVKFLIDGRSGYGYLTHNLSFPLEHSSD
ncbi:MAG: GerMN domain-containing protein [Oscillospiraceae bacterium]|nr:GerMN domain-containing protein [Oscillospiraceae bacterium]